MTRAPSTIRVLVVEPYRGWRIGVGDALVAAGYEVWTARCGEDALTTMRTLADSGRAIDLLLTELELGDTTGAELDRRAHTLWPRLRVLYMSYDAHACGERLCKPFSLAALEQAVRRALGTRRSSPRCAPSSGRPHGWRPRSFLGIAAAAVKRAAP